MKFKVEIFVSPRKEILDPQGKAVEQALQNLQFAGVSGVRVGKYMDFVLESDGEGAAREAVDVMCQKLLANPVVEDYRIEITPLN